MLICFILGILFSYFYFKKQYNNISLKELYLQRDQLNKDLLNLEKQKEIYLNSYKENLELNISNLNQQYLKQKEILDQNFFSYKEEKENEFLKLDKLIQDKKREVDASVEDAIRKEKIKQQKDFYRLNISPQQEEEIKKLREVEKYLTNKTALDKAIWKIYYEKPTQDLVSRVVGNKVKTGIYKITNIKNQKTYVGQSVNIAERFKQHIKRGLGAETATKNKLYPAMYEEGVENFIFEIVEECPKEELNSREDFWQNFFHSIEYGYSIK